VVDNNQSGGVITSYIVTTTQQIAQNTITNQANLGANIAGIIYNLNDERFLQNFDVPLGCTSWKVQDLSDNNAINNVATFAANEIQAS
jgi:hypothetical protein